MKQTDLAVGEEIAGVLTRMIDGGEGIARVFVSESLASIAAEHEVESAELRSVWEDQLQLCVDEALGVADDGSRDRSVVGEQFANAGRALTDSLQILHDLRRAAIEVLRRQAVAEGFDERWVIAGINRVSLSMNHYVLAFSNGYFRAEVANRARRRTQQDTFVWSLLSGTTSDGDGFNRLGAYGLDATVPYMAFRARAADDAEHVRLEGYLGLSGHGPNRHGVSTVIDGDVCGFLTELPDGDAPVLIGVSGPVPLAELSAAFRRATRAFHVARLAELSGAHSLEDLGLLASVMTDRDIADVLTTSYLQPLRRAGEYGDTLLHTIRCFIESDCQVDVTAKELVLHVNTVRYRLTKFEEMLGISLRDTRSLAEVWWAIQLPDEFTVTGEARTA